MAAPSLTWCGIWCRHCRLFWWEGGGGVISHQHQVVGEARHKMGMGAKHGGSVLTLVRHDDAVIAS